MKTLFLCCLLTIIFFSSRAQSDARHDRSRDAAYKRNAASKRTYRFPEFVNGTVYFTSGRSRTARLNYNYRHGLIEFIDSHQDTLVFTGKHLMDRVEIGRTVFFLNEENGDMEQIGRYDGVILAQKTRPEIVGDKLHYSGQRFSASSTVQPSSLFVGTSGWGVQWQNNSFGESYRVKSSYYLIDGNRAFHEASKSNVMKIYGRYKGAVKTYLSDNKVDFRNHEDLHKLLSFCATLADRSTEEAQ
ncbi:hypothetical protein [Dyadobacter sp. MSC1_007]|jgi:hypothetical protein|uniref:hypothetical protein n=1 Tax=Dyadobacter sp. MSC1_007 TaxID=2909264 RepID=UPI0020309616|nr:hypothetical protein [Dyadobacter sp. MSC1_007]